MARLRDLAKGTQTVGVHPTEVDGYYQAVNGSDGTTYLHLSTFGSENRQSSPKSSQSIQIDLAMAQKLIAVLRETFPTLP